MQARAAAVSPPPVAAEQPDSSNAEAVAATAIEINEDFFTSLPFCGVRRNSSSTTVGFEQWQDDCA